MPLPDRDFKFYQNEIKEDIREHDSKLRWINRPEEVKAAYQGRFHSGDLLGNENPSRGEDDPSITDEKRQIIENYLFISAATALPSLFFQLPRMHIRSERLPFEAAILTALINKDFNEQDKEENQLAIIDAFLPWGYGVIKTGYNSKTGIVKPNIFTGKSGKTKPDNIEGDNEFLEFERTLALRQSPKTTYLDRTQPFGKGNRISFVYQRTLQQLIDSNLYQLSQNFIQHFSVGDRDKRLIKMELTEAFILLKGKVWKLAFVDGWTEEIAWVQTEYDELPRSLLRFNKMGDVLYNISHGTLGLFAQKELNYLTELRKKHVDNMRNQHMIEKAALDEGADKTVKANDIGGIVYTKKPPLGVAVPLQSASTDPRLFEETINVREYLKLLLSTSGAKAGGPDSKLATVERNKALGDALRSSGLQDDIRSFMVHQMKQRIKNYLRLASPEMTLMITGENLVNPATDTIVEPGTQLELGGEKGLDLRKIITGELEVDFIFDVDITSAQRPDFPVIREQLAEGIRLGKELLPDLEGKGKTIDFDKQLEDYYGTFDAIPDAKKYIREMSDEEKQQRLIQIQLQAQQAQLEAGGGAPTEGGIAAGAEAVPTPTGDVGAI